MVPVSLRQLNPGPPYCSKGNDSNNNSTGYMGPSNRGRIIAQRDNEAVVAVINSRYSSDKYLMQMLCCLFFIEAQYQCQVKAIHISGTLNKLADHLSRDNVNLFHYKLRTANLNPSYVPSSLVQGLKTHQFLIRKAKFLSDCVYDNS